VSAAHPRLSRGERPFARAVSGQRVRTRSQRTAFEDEDISAALVESLEGEGLRIVPAFKTTRVEKRDGRYLLTGLKNDAEVVFDAEQLLVATGRRPNTAGMGLEEAGVRLGQRGEIRVNDLL
jgi:mercuric reductase